VAAETERKASIALRKQAQPKKQKRIKETVDRSDLANRFGPSGDLVVGLDQYDRYILMQQDPTTGNQTPVYVFIDPNGKDFSIENGTSIIKKVKESYKDQEALRKILYDKDYISEKDYLRKDTSALNKAILHSATEFSTEIADSFNIEGKIKFPTFDSWMSGKQATGGAEGGPRRDIQMYDRDVIKAMVRDVYMQETGNAPDEQYLNEKTNFYMDMIKKGTLTSSKNIGGEYVVKGTAGFSESRLRSELPGQIQKERPTDISSKKSLDFLAFLADLGG
jgi:hypothetical protein